MTDLFLGQVRHCLWDIFALLAKGASLLGRRGHLDQLLCPAETWQIRIQQGVGSTIHLCKFPIQRQGTRTEIIEDSKLINQACILCRVPPPGAPPAVDSRNHRALAAVCGDAGTTGPIIELGITRRREFSNDARSSQACCAGFVCMESITAVSWSSWYTTMD